MVCVRVLGGWGERAEKRGKEGKERERKRIESKDREQLWGCTKNGPFLPLIA